MNCKKCNSVNREGVRYCTKCGNPLFLFCIQCNFSLIHEDLFCGGCGAEISHFGDPKIMQHAGEKVESADLITPPSIPPAKVVPSMESERKNVTVLFADISGFTSMSEKLDPEEVTELMNGCLKIMADSVIHYEGHVDKFIGDCIMAIFGAPITHENDPELAIRAALEMNKKIDEFNKVLPIKLEKPLALHTGINTGVVIAGGVGSDQKMEYTVMGDTVNLAARLESNAANGQIFVSGYTYNLTRNMFDFIPHEPIKVKGKKDPVAVYKVEKIKSISSRDKKFTKLVPLVGRQQEMKQLLDCTDKLLKGEGLAVFLISDLGIGKSRIQYEVKKQLDKKDVQIIEGICYSFSRYTSYYAFTEIFKNFFNIDSDDLEESITEKIAQNLPLLLGLNAEVLNPMAREAIVFIGFILGVKLGDDYDVPIAQMSAEEIKTAVFRSIAWFFEELAKSKPVLLALQDLHYADNTTIELVAYLFKALKSSPVMIFLLMRPDKNHPAFNLLQVAKKNIERQPIEITFNRLTSTECDKLVRTLLETEKIPDEILHLIRERGDGNPLFIGEIIRSLEGEGVLEKSDDGTIFITKELDQISIPDSINGVILTRVDHLQSGLKEILHVASVIGNVFKYELIKRVAKARDIDDRLNLLCDLGMIFESQSFPEIEYSFNNILIQKAVLSTLIAKKRKKLHASVANTIEELFEKRLDDQYEILSHHFHEAGEKNKAYSYLVKSGMKAKEAYANRDAIDYFSKAIHLGGGSPGLTEEFPLGVVYTALSEVLELFGQMEDAIEARENAINEIREETGKAEAVRHIGRIHEKKGNREKALESYDRGFKLLENHPDSVVMGKLLMNQSWILNRMHKFDDALEKGMVALKIFKKCNSKEDTAYIFNNLGVYFEHKEDLEQAQEYNKKSLDLFIELGNKRQQANVLLSLGFLHNNQNELEKALDYFERSYELMERIGNYYGAGTALMSRGRCHFDLGQFDESECALKMSLNIHIDLNLKKKIIANELALTKVYLQMSNNQLAGEHLDSAKSIAQENNYISDLGKVAQLEARLLVKEGKEPDEKYNTAIDLFKSLGRDQDAATVLKELEDYGQSKG